MTDPMSPDAAEWGIEHATEETLHGWLTVHNVLIPNAPLTLADARERLSRHRPARSPRTAPPAARSIGP